MGKPRVQLVPDKFAGPLGGGTTVVIEPCTLTVQLRSLQAAPPWELTLFGFVVASMEPMKTCKAGMDLFSPKGGLKCKARRWRFHPRFPSPQAEATSRYDFFGQIVTCRNDARAA